MVPDAQKLIDDAYARWSRLLIGADFWRNAAACSSEMGWRLSGFGRVVRSVALRRAKLWDSSDSNWHATFFRMSAGVEGSWAKRSSLVLEQWSVTDWPHWHCPGKSIDRYREYIDGVLQRSYATVWLQIASNHRSDVPYLQFDGLPGTGVLRWRRVALQFKSWCRFRCGLMRLRHMSGRESAARHQHCIFCNNVVRNGMVHCLSICTRWSDQRRVLSVCCICAPWTLARRLLLWLVCAVMLARRLSRRW